jgi:hypothetical protein
VERLLAQERAEARAAEMECLARLLGARVGAVLAADLQPLGAEGLAFGGDRGDEAAAGLHPAAEHDAPR